jgi:hypothetical protein
MKILKKFLVDMVIAAVFFYQTKMEIIFFTYSLSSIYESFPHAPYQILSNTLGSSIRKVD